MKISLHFLVWLITMAATVCAWFVYGRNLASPEGVATLMLTLGVSVWGFVVASPQWE